MATIQGNRGAKASGGPSDFAAMLRDYTRTAGLTYEGLAEAAGLPLDTLLNWTKGRVRRPRHWEDVAQVARALRLNATEADALLRAATHPALELLKHAHPDDARLADWPRMAMPSVARVRPVYAATAPLPTHFSDAPVIEQTAPLPALDLLALAEEQRGLVATPSLAAPLANSPTRRQWRARRLVVGGGLMLVLLAAIIGLMVALNQSANLPVVGGWSVVGPLEISPTSVAPDGRLYVMVGQWVTVTLHLHNDSGAPNTLPQLGLGGRGPDGCKNWVGQNANFPGIGPITILPGGMYVYQTSNRFSKPGVYFVEPNWGDGRGHYGGITPYPRVWFTVTADPNHLPPPDCLTPVPPSLIPGLQL